ncbi:N-acetylmuramoyl-L-alanine amidase [Nocardioides sp. NBC_00850]|uniref:N-acetylmuramoyl-L-alanine amidase n=1 Tax=Nocardioides sp. NBC_00850 TaxID=2976001 RepID=UPI0038636C22|nr:N-acetylmuramoyl-L-alanine amidase [Nocardioides sp. NBC_00850]
MHSQAGEEQSSDVERARSRYVASTQQLLVLGFVLAALVPASTVVDLKVVRPGEVPVSGNQVAVPSAAQVPSDPVDAHLEEISLTAPSGHGVAGRITAEAKKATSEGDAATVISLPQPVDGFGTVGLTWAPGAVVPEEAVGADVRTLEDGTWSAWQALDVHVDDHAPDPDSAEADGSRPGTMEAVVGEVDQVQTRLRLTGAEVPADLRLAVITPGEAAASRSESPEIETGADDAPEPAEATEGTQSAEEGEAATLSAAAYTSKPSIYSRRQWGADESVREAGPPDYHEVRGGFVHHTVNTNSYTRDQVPGIIRSIYAYHVQSRGWRDIGYNFLVDKFGRIWEGRYGGVDRPVVGAHTSGHNSYGFGASAIGNFDNVAPPTALVNAFGTLFAWKLSLHGVRGNKGSTRMGDRTFSHAIMGHRDAGSTACPGRYLYAKLSTIRSQAGSKQASWAARELQSQISGRGYPDLVARRSSDRRIVVIRTDGNARLGTPRATNLVGGTSATLMNAGDWDRDGDGDILIRHTDGTIRVNRGNGTETFATGVIIGRGFGSVSVIDVVSDITGDGWPDLVGKHSSGEIRVWPGRGTSALGAPYRMRSAVSGSTQVIGAGRFYADDGSPEVVVRVSSKLLIFRTNGPGGLTTYSDPGIDTSVFDFILATKDLRGASTGGDLLLRRKSDGMWFAYEHNQSGGWDRKSQMGALRGYDQFG